MRTDCLQIVIIARCCREEKQPLSCRIGASIGRKPQEGERLIAKVEVGKSGGYVRAQPPIFQANVDLHTYMLARRYFDFIDA
jgi:hypothetical protein